MTFWLCQMLENFPTENFLIFPPPWLGGGKINSIIVTLKSLIKHSLMLFQRQTQQHKQNLTNLNYVYGYFSITNLWPLLRTTFSDLNQPKKIAGKFEDVQKTPEFWFLPEEYHPSLCNCLDDWIIIDNDR